MVINLFDFRKKKTLLKLITSNRNQFQNYIFLVESVNHCPRIKKIKLITPHQYTKNGNIVNKKIIIKAIHP